MHRQFINSCLSCSVCFFTTSSPQFFIFLVICCLIFSEDWFFMSNSPHKLFLSLWAWSVHWFACCSCYRWDSNSWLLSWRAISVFSLSQCFTSTSAVASHKLCWAIFSLRAANSAFRSRMLCWFCWSFNVLHNVFVSISLPLWLHDPCPHKFPWCMSDLQQNRNPPTVSWG